MAYDIGDTVPLAVDLVDADGDPSAADTVTVTITLPDDTTTSPTPTSPSTGRYEVDYEPAQAGRYVAVWTSTGPATSWEDVFDVVERPAPALSSLADLKRHLNKTDSADDEELRLHLSAATISAEQHLGEVIAKRQFTDRLRVAAGRERLLLTRHPVLRVTAIASAVDDTTWDPDDFVVEPSGLLTRVSGPSLPCGLVDVTYTAGARVITPNRQLAGLIIAAHLWETQQTSHLTGGPTYDEQILTPSGLGYAIPHRAVELLGARGPMIV